MLVRFALSKSTAFGRSTSTTSTPVATSASSAVSSAWSTAASTSRQAVRGRPTRILSTGLTGVPAIVRAGVSASSTAAASSAEPAITPTWSIDHESGTTPSSEAAP
jgi:hypothetical protein